MKLTRDPQGFARRASGYALRIRTEKQEIALLQILVACGERALEAFQASDNPVNDDFVADLERVIARSRDELAALSKKSADPS